MIFFILILFGIIAVSFLFLNKNETIYNFFIKLSSAFNIDCDITIFEEIQDEITYNGLYSNFIYSPKYIKKITKGAGININFKAYLFACLLMSFVFSTLSAILCFFYLNSHIALNIGVIFISFIFGFYFLYIILFIKTNIRIKKVDKKISIFIDLIIVCLNAGLPFKQTFFLVSEEFEKIDKDIAKELKRTSRDLSIFLNQREAFEDLLERLPSKNLEQFISIIFASQEKGGSVVDILLKSSESMFDDYIYKIEQRAEKIKSVLPLLLTIFTIPVVLIIIIAPYINNIKGLFS